MELLPVWKRIYPVIATNNPNVTDDIVENVLDICKLHITEVFLQYEPYSKDSLAKWKQHLGLQEIICDDEMCNFVHNLSKELDLDANVAWTVICNFLMFEYYGKVDELKTLIKFDSKIEYLTLHIWYFYSADRMFLLKTLRYLFENFESESCHKKIQAFVKGLDITQLWKNLSKVLYNLIHEIGKDKVKIVSRDILTEWINRNNREQVEVIFLMMQILQHLKLTGLELEKILSLFIRNGFTRYPLLPEVPSLSKKEDLCQVKYAEIALVLAIMDLCWKSPEIIKKIPITIEKNLELLQIQGDNSIIMFAWMIFKISSDKMEADLEVCGTVVEEMLNKKIFLSLYQFLSHRMFYNCKVGDIVINAVYSLMWECSKMCADFTYLHEQEGVGKIVAILLKKKGLVVLETLGPILQLSMESFPFAFEPFLDMCSSLISMPDKYDKIMKLLKSIPTFLAESMWSYRESQYTIQSPQTLFVDSELFVAPEGTLVERFMYQGVDLSRYHYPFSFFLLMEQFTKSLNVISFEIGPSWHCYNNLAHLVHVGFKFIHDILKLYKNDYRKDTELRTLIQRLEIVPTQFCDGPAKNFDFIRIYFAINCTLIKRELLDYMEAFPPIQRKKFMPIAKNFSKKTNKMSSDLHNRCQLYRSLQEEEEKDTHTLLIDYLELIHFIIQKNIYEYDVQLPGMWYILNRTFPIHQQWSYADPHEKIVISKLCMSSFVEIVKRHLFNGNNNSTLIFNMLIDAFYNEEIVISSFMAVVPSDKYHLQKLMEDELDWLGGVSLEHIECFKLQLVLMLLLYKYKAGTGSKTSILDDNVGFFAKGVTPFIINPYSLGLRQLSCKFLELLSRDQNVPLMALLGLDYDQVQRLYLDRLRDITEDDDLKVLILELIGTCVVYQHGMTAAFFNVKRSRKWYSDNKENTIEGDTVSDFMVDYLKNIKKSPKFLKNPLQIGILHVMTNLWTSRKKHLIEEIINLKEFWPLLSDPLYREFDQSPKVYGFIFRIYGIQLIELKNESQFLLSIENFLTNSSLIKKWIKYFQSTFNIITSNVDDIDDRKFLLRCWIEFLIMVEKSEESKKLDDGSKFELICMSLDGVSFSLVNTYCLRLWMDLVLLQLSYWKISTDKAKIVVEKAVNAMCKIKSFYDDLEHSGRLAVLTVIQKFIEKFGEHFQSCSRDLMELLQQFGPMMDYEYALAVEEKNWISKDGCFDTAVREQLLPWMLCVRIVSDLLDLKNIEDIGSWFAYRNMVDKLIKSSCEFIQNNSTQPLVKVLLHCLTLYSNSPLYLDFLNVNTNQFFMNIEESISVLLCGQNNKINPIQLEEGWITCLLLIKFQTAYFNSLQFHALPNCFNFVTLNENILTHIFNILETTVALKALDVVINALVLFDSMLKKWAVEWYRKSNVTYNFVLNGVKKVVNACLYAILRPKNILMYMLDESHRFIQLEKYPVELMVAIVNRLVLAAGLGFSILYRANPNLIDLLDLHLPDNVVLLVNNDFSVPKFELPITNNLTYGMLLCVAHFLCKTLDALLLNKNQTKEFYSVTPENFFKCFGMIEHQGFSDNVPTHKLSAFLRYAMYEYSGLADPWIQKLDYNLVRDSLEFLMLFLAQQIFLSVKTIPMALESYFKRNLKSELQFFYEHVKKSTSILLNAAITPQCSSFCRNETDILKKYLVHYKETNSLNDVTNNNFCVIISYWFTNICRLK